MTSPNFEKSFWETILEFKHIFAIFFAVVIGLVLIFNFVSFGYKSNYAFESDWVRGYNVKIGKENAEVKLIYFYDLQCPACKSNDPDLQKIVDKYKDRIEIVYRNMPLTNLHPFALPAAQGAQAVAKQNKDFYFEFKKQIFANQESLNISTIESTAKRIEGLNYDQWLKDYQSNNIVDEVKFDEKDIKEATLPESTITKDAKNVGLTKSGGTPTNIVLKNNKIFDWWTGGLSAEKQGEVIDRALLP